ncbi:hypothetical protein AB0D13_07375 [Streptomyces sp. NPDC048430]|uniref:hypothetical protein n=1 Tax=Streptomyces sp. NPDC048430 TaxID=3155388 RepID=UPI00342E7E12
MTAGRGRPAATPGSDTAELRAFTPEVRPRAEIFPPGHRWSSEEGLRRCAEPVPEHAGAADRSGVPQEVAEKATFEAVADAER